MGKCYTVILDAQYGIDIEKIRRDLRVGANRSLQKYFDIEVLGPGQKPNDGARNLVFTLNSYSLYIWGIKNKQGRFYFKDYKGLKFQDTHCSQLPFGGSYTELDAWNFQARGNHDDKMRVPISSGEVMNAFYTIEGLGVNDVVRKNHKQSMALFIMLISEALRFDIICSLFAKVFADGRDSTLTRSYIHMLVCNWSKSTKVGDPYVEVPNL